MLSVCLLLGITNGSFSWSFPTWMLYDFLTSCPWPSYAVTEWRYWTAGVPEWPSAQQRGDAPQVSNLDGSSTSWILILPESFWLQTATQGCQLCYVMQCACKPRNAQIHNS
jgi:hypothetical protein